MTPELANLTLKYMDRVQTTGITESQEYAQCVNALVAIIQKQQSSDTAPPAPAGPGGAKPPGTKKAATRKRATPKRVQKK